MKKVMITAGLLALLGVSSEAHAVGCISGGAAGAVAGHYAGHHAVLGAVGGCIAGHEMHKKQVAARKLKQQQDQQQNLKPAQ
ncbi:MULTISPECIES: hypothetical protein [unclassified Rhizobium]|jgi:hypothetical protein|uniref:hypothetical protein n=1 Tax=unclassified Rhizobium TaxID=2613769 RepID=UPI0006486683|nr:MULTISPECIES: hypothetical protein [unclassified Rhizobium]OJY63738.1 MAG: hypothetical protein BGP09_00540 [Rhizobium sp. 60-20]RKD60719.1 hypothetical protein BJ928_1085 [Rhizobium sp. WW_1]